ncbi:hypothetical protein MPSEU_000888400 [Mayamaea pseudoterrestris]|nr:hypothetical protein MPSEU_000888400 [Mayamaea pseudoterrestris]
MLRKSKIFRSLRRWTAVLLLLVPRSARSLAIASKRYEASRNRSHESHMMQRCRNTLNAAATPTELSSYTVKVSYEGMSREILVMQNESILSAMERRNVAQEVGLPDLPSECRRGCCLSCSARHHEDSVFDNLYQGTDGLNPHLSKDVVNDGFVLTCSSYVNGNGVHLSLSHNSEAWQAMYQGRLLSEETQLSGREAMARVIRQNAERNVDQWIEETEQVYRGDLE